MPSVTSAEYTAAYEQVKSLGEEHSATRTTDQTELAIYWGYDVARGLGDPPRLYNQIARVIAVQQGNSVGANARLFALINIAQADAGIQSWGVKYRDVFWRPIVAIHNGGTGGADDTDGNPDTVGDAAWSPLGAPRTNPQPGEDVNFTPPFPAYTSGHATFGGAAFKMMANFYRADDIHFSIPFDFISDEFNGLSRDIHDAIPDLVLDHVRQIRPRHFESFSQAAAENAASRIFLGIHWRFDAVEGISAGNRIADYAYDHILRPSHGSSRFHIASVDFAAQIDSYLDGTYTTSFPTNPAPGPETPERIVAAIVALITAPGQFDFSMVTRLQPLAQEVMTYLWNTSTSFQQMVEQLDRAAELDGHVENPSLAIMEAEVTEDIFKAIGLLDPFLDPFFLD